VITRDISPSDCISYDAVLARIYPPPHTPPRFSELSAGARPLVADFCAAFVAEPGPVTPRVGACARLKIGPTQEIKYEHAGLIDSLLFGSVRRVSVASIYRLLILKAIASHPVDGPPARARLPAGRYTRKPRELAPKDQLRRQPTPRELDALRRGNESRRLAALARRAKAAPPA
jgi:hypothetical protein